MSSEVEICNLALSMVGQSPIISFESPQNRKEELCALWYPIARDAIVEHHEWSFATRRAIIETEVLPMPTWGFTRAMPKPADALRITWCGESDDEQAWTIKDWRIEDKYILVNWTRTYCRYIARVTDTTFFSPLVVLAIASRLALSITLPITENQKLLRENTALHSQYLIDAVNTDNLQGRSEIRKSKLLITNR